MGSSHWGEEGLSRWVCDGGWGWRDHRSSTTITNPHLWGIFNPHPQGSRNAALSKLPRSCILSETLQIHSKDTPNSPSPFRQTVCVTQSCPTLCDPILRLYPVRLLCPWDFPGKNTGVFCHSLLQGIFLTRGSKRVSCMQADSEPPGIVFASLWARENWLRKYSSKFLSSPLQSLKYSFWT